MDATEVSTPAADGAPRGPRRLRRRPDDGHIAGVCAGVAEYFDIDPLIVRIAAVVLLFTGPGAFAYVLAWIFVPAVPGPATHGTPRAPIDPKDRATQVFGIVLIVLAVSVFWGDWWSPARGWLVPVGLMALGAWLLLRSTDDAPAPPPPPPVPPVPPPAPSPPPAARAWGAPPGDPTATTLADPLAVEDPTLVGPTIPPPTDPLPGPAGDSEPPEPPPPLLPARSRRRMLGPIVFGALLVWAGIAVLVDASLETGLAGGLLIIGVGFVFGAFVGGSRVLILPALVVGAALAVAATIDIPLDGPIGQQRWTPESLDDLDERYELSLGEGTLDLAAVAVPAGDEVEVAASVGMGHLVVLVPPELAVDVTADVGAGEVHLFGLEQNGVDLTTEARSPGSASSGTLALDVRAGLGHVEVRLSQDTVITPATTTTTLG
jgi:phage shock protein PspC (stress-responsive transcriptional regulator)